MSAPPPELLARARPDAEAPAEGLAVLADWLAERGDDGGLLTALADPELRPLGVQRFEATETIAGARQTHAFDVAVFRFEPFAERLGLADDARAPETELVLLPALGQPGRETYLDRVVELAPFLIFRAPLTRALFGDAGGSLPQATDDEPNAYREYLAWGAERWLALPEPEQWTHAARGGSQHAAYWSGDRPPADAPLDLPRPVPVGTTPANAYGLHDVHGNIWETLASFPSWIGGGFSSDPDDAELEPAFTDPWIDEIGPRLGVRYLRPLPGWRAPLDALVGGAVPAEPLLADAWRRGEQAIPLWEALLRQANSALRSEALDALDALGGAAERAWLRLLAAPLPSLRDPATQRLRLLVQDPGVLTPLLAHPGAAVRRRAVELITDVGQRTNTRPLDALRVALDDVDPEVVQLARQALARFGAGNARRLDRPATLSAPVEPLVLPAVRHLDEEQYTDDELAAVRAAESDDEPGCLQGILWVACLVAGLATLAALLLDRCAP